jgi:uncharacterized protein YegP (UPF0339 family)
MTKLLCTAVLFAGMAGLVSTTTMSSAPAQDKKDTKKDTKAGKAATIEINQGKDDKYRFTIRDAEGKLLAMSGPTGWEKREDAVKAVEALKEALPKAVVTSPAKKDPK